MPFASRDVIAVGVRSDPDNGAARSYVWAVELGWGRRPGWVYLVGGDPGPGEWWIAAELNRLEHHWGRATLERRLVAPGGLCIGRGLRFALAQRRFEARDPVLREAAGAPPVCER